MIGWLGICLVGLGATIGWLGVGRDAQPNPPIREIPLPDPVRAVEAVGFVDGPPGEADRGVIDPDKDRRLGAAIRQARSSSVSIEYVAGGAVPSRRVASGVVINDQGDLLSIRIDPPARRDGPPIIATDAQGHRHPVRWLGADPDTGLTLLRLRPRALPPVRLAANDAALGAEVFLVGNPYGLGHSISRGHVGGLGRRLNIAGRAVAGLIQVQAPIHPGDSGAPLADLDGGWLGLVRGGLELPNLGAGRGDDLAFVIPSREALWVADQLRGSGRVDRAYLGLRFAADAALRTLILPAEGPPAAPVELDPIAGARVAAVLPDSPAAQAHLQPGDRVVRMDDQPITGANDLTDRLEWTAAGAQIALEYIRGSARDRITLRAGSRPSTAPSPPPHDVPNPTGVNAHAPTDLPATAPSTADETTAALIRSLQQQVDRLERRIGDLERERSHQGSHPGSPR